MSAGKKHEKRFTMRENTLLEKMVDEHPILKLKNVRKQHIIEQQIDAWKALAEQFEVLTIKFRIQDNVIVHGNYYNLSAVLKIQNFVFYINMVI